MSEFCQKYWCSSNGDFSLACCQCVRGKSSIKVIESSWILFFGNLRKNHRLHMFIVFGLSIFFTESDSPGHSDRYLVASRLLKAGEEPRHHERFPSPFSCGRIVRQIDQFSRSYRTFTPMPANGLQRLDRFLRRRRCVPQARLRVLLVVGCWILSSSVFSISSSRCQT